jgi:trans-aconitate 2-methyltransferase
MTVVDAWDPGQYNRFASEREQPFWDLTHLLAPTSSPRVVDLGCGDGRLTAALHDALGAGETLGIDSSAAMIDGTQEHARPDVTFQLGDIGAWEQPGTYDVVFANASMQWVPDHAGVLRRWLGSLVDGGQLAVQVPANADHPSHTVAVEVAAEMLDEPPPDVVAQRVLRPEEYAVLLDELGCVEQHVRLQVYTHHLAASSDVVEWVKGTSLTRFKEPLGPARWDEFVARYRTRLLDVIGDRAPYLYPFKRILLWGRRG